jgi:aryl-alcohol dehydrogenase-like predicted oxidoreductase
MLTGAVRSTAGFDRHDLRRRVPRFDAGNLERNLMAVDELTTLAREIGCSPAQLALGWLLAQGDDVVALPGCERVAHAEENAAAADLKLNAAQLAGIDALFRPGTAAGARFEAQHFVDR